MAHDLVADKDRLPMIIKPGFKGIGHLIDPSIGNPPRSGILDRPNRLAGTLGEPLEIDAVQQSLWVGLMR